MPTSILMYSVMETKQYSQSMCRINGTLPTQTSLNYCLFLTERKHYCLIKNFNRLIALRTEKSHNSMHYCRRCLIGYRRIEALNKHSEYCSQHAAQKIEL